MATVFTKMARKARAAPRKVWDMTEEGDFLGELKAKGYLDDYLENRMEVLNKDLAPRFQKFLDAPSSPGEIWNRGVNPVSLAKTEVSPFQKTNLDIDRVIKEVNDSPGIRMKREAFEGGYEMDFRDLMGGQNPKALFSNKSLLEQQGPLSVSGFRNDSVIKNKRAKWGLGMKSSLEANEPFNRPINEYQQLMGGRNQRPVSPPRAIKNRQKSPFQTSYHLKSAMQFGIGAAGVGLLGYGLASRLQDEGLRGLPGSWAVTGPGDLAVGMMAPQGTLPGPQVVSPDGPMSFSTQSIGKFSPDRMGATGDLTLALHNKRRA